MCGIVGYIGNKNATNVLIDGLTRLEYRGYDSAGIALIIDGEIVVERSVGKLNNLKSKIADKNLFSNLGIGHTRWATHGKPSDENAHPHRSGDIVIVHNGIIENYLELKKDLISKGYKFSSETDTEVIAHLLNANWIGDLFRTVQKVVKILRGAYALAIISKNEPDKIILARNEPLLTL